MGFSINYASDNGFWGRALYFAVNAKYSNDGYVFKLPSGEKQLFLVEVLIGDSVTLPISRDANNPLRDTPNKPDGTPYDSVHGNTNGSDVYMVYHSCKAYPRYLVTYTS